MKFRPKLSVNLLLICIILTTVYSCNKNMASISNMEINAKITEARALIAQRSKYGKNDEKFRILTLHWEKAHTLTEGGDKEFLVVPTENLNTIVLKNGQTFRRFVVFIYLRDKLMNAAITEIIGDIAYLDMNTDFLISNNYRKQITGFTGFIKRYDINYDDLYPGLFYENGVQVSRNSTILSNRRPGEKNAKGGPLLRAPDGAIIGGYYVDTYLLTIYPNGTQTKEFISQQYITAHHQTEEYPSGGGGAYDQAIMTDMFARSVKK